MKNRNARRLIPWLASSALVIATFAGAIPASHAAGVVVPNGTLERVSIDAGASGGRETPAMSADARYVVFVGRGTGGQGVWAVDRGTGVTKHLTTGDDMDPDVSDTGRFVAYTRRGAASEVYLLDRDSDGNGVFDESGRTKTYTVSVDNSGIPSSAPANFGAVSADGRYVAFQAKSDLDGTPACKSGGGPDKVYVWDRLSGKVQMASVSTGTDGKPCAVNGNALMPSITPDGRFVTFTSDASVLMPAVAPIGAAQEVATPAQVFVRDRVAGTTTLASVGIGGVVGDGPSATTRGATISDNGRYVAFESDAANLVSGDTNANTDAFVRDMVAKKTVRVSVDAAGAQVTLAPYTEPPCTPPTTTTTTTPTTTTTVAAAAAPGGEGTTPLPAVGAAPSISGDGRYVGFDSEAPLTTDDQNEVDGVRMRDVYRYDTTTGALVRVSAAAAVGVEASGCRTDGHTGQSVPAVNGTDAQLGRDGRTVVFGSQGDLTLDRPAETEGVAAAAVAPATAFESAVYARTIGMPTVTTVSPAKLAGGFSGAIVVNGTNFTAAASPGGLSVALGSGITVTQVTWQSSTRLLVTVKVDPGAQLGPRDVTVRNPAGDGATCTGCLTIVAAPPVIATGELSGYRLAGSDGGVFAYGSARFYGSMGGVRLNASIVAIAATRSGLGYYLVASDGGVFSFGDAQFHGSLGALKLNAPIVGIATTTTGNGYELVGSDGGVFSFGDAQFHGSLGALKLNAPIVGIDTTENGYRLVASDGGLFSFGDAPFYGSAGALALRSPMVGMADLPHGYWLVASDGGVFAFGNAPFLGASVGAAKDPVTGILALANHTGYHLVTATGEVISFGAGVPLGNMHGSALNAPIVGISG